MKKYEKYACHVAPPNPPKSMEKVWKKYENNTRLPVGDGCARGICSRQGVPCLGGPSRGPGAPARACPAAPSLALGLAWGPGPGPRVWPGLGQAEARCGSCGGHDVRRRSSHVCTNVFVFPPCVRSSPVPEGCSMCRIGDKLFTIC